MNNVNNDFSILSSSDLKKYVNLWLLNDEDFISDLDESQVNSESFKSMSKNQRIKALDYLLSANTARICIVNIITLKHLYRLAIKNKNNFLDVYWEDKIKNIIK